MPAINPNNYNIDFFNSYNFGDMTDTSYVNYLFSQNLPQIPQELIDGAAGNFLSQYNEKGLEKDINYTPITNPGDLDEWFVNGGVPVDLNDIRNNVIFKDNEYGPAVYQAYNCPNLEDPEETGFIQYPTEVGGNTVMNLVGEGLDAVGLGGLNNLFLIDFPSELNEIANDRRLEELKSRVKENLISETIGRVNLDPLSLLRGTDFFQKDYRITKDTPRGTLGGLGVGVLTDLTDVNLQGIKKEPIPDGAFDWDKPLNALGPFSVDTIDISKKLLNRTGKATRGLLMKSLELNYYGPIIEGQNQPEDFEKRKPKSSDDFKTPKNPKTGYLAFGDSPTFKASKEEEERRKEAKEFEDDRVKNLKTSAKQQTGGFVANLDEVTIKAKAASQDSRPDINLTPREFDVVSTTSLSTNDNLKSQGFEFEYFGNELDTTIERQREILKNGHNGGWFTLFQGGPFITPAYEEFSSYEGTWTSVDGTVFRGDNQGHEPGAQVWNNDLYWADGRTEDLPKRGLLKYTQDLINKSTNVPGAPAMYVGFPNSPQNYDAESGDRRHINFSQGSLVKETKEDKYFCRSWSVRRAYNRYNDLIRHDELWRNTQPGTILDKKPAGDKGTKLNQYRTMQVPGVPKIAWERDGIIEQKIEKLKSLAIGKEYVIPYMFSIENLAWLDSPHYRKLPKNEMGPHGGRIMWFPPYNLNFTDNTSVNWDTTSFIGRAEPIYTYNNTERTGTLSFSMIVDHPSVINKLRDDAFVFTKTNEDGTTDTMNTTNNLESFFAGCDANTTKEMIREAFKEIHIPEIEVDEIPEKEPEIIEQEIPEVKAGVSFFFKNARSANGGTNSIESKESIYKKYYPDYQTNSKCPNKKDKNTIGRCFDWYYESKDIMWLENPKLYLTGDQGCKHGLYGQKGTIGTMTPAWAPILKAEMVDDTTILSFGDEPGGGLGETNLGKVLAIGGPAAGQERKWYSFDDIGTLNTTYSSNARKMNTKPLPCGGPSNPDGSWGPRDLDSCKTLWSSIRENKRFCNKNLPTTHTFTDGNLAGTTHDTNKVGVFNIRNGFNSRFLGTGAFDWSLMETPPYEANLADPSMDLPVEHLPYGEWKFACTDSYDENNPGTVIGVAGKGVSQLIEYCCMTWQGKAQRINFVGQASTLASTSYNRTLGRDRGKAIAEWFRAQMIICENQLQTTEDDRPYLGDKNTISIKLYKESSKKVPPANALNQWSRYAYESTTKGESKSVSSGLVPNVGGCTKRNSPSRGEWEITPSRIHPDDLENICQIVSRRSDIYLTPNPELLKPYYDAMQEALDNQINATNEAIKNKNEDAKAAAKAKEEAEKQKAIALAKNFINEADYFYKLKEDDSFLYDNLKDKLKNFHPAFHSTTPEGFNERINFLQQCGRQGPSFIDPNQPQNTAFGRPPVCILRLGDFYFTKIIIDTINFTFDPLQWDMNPEGVGLQPMLVNVDLNFKFIGGSTLQGPLTQLQNAVSYNFFANTAIYKPLEEILARRGNAGQILLEGDEGFDELENESRYWYGPWAGQEDFMNAVNPKEEPKEQTKGEQDSTTSAESTSQPKQPTTQQQQAANILSTQNPFPNGPTLEPELIGPRNEDGSFAPPTSESSGIDENGTVTSTTTEVGTPNTTNDEGVPVFVKRKESSRTSKRGKLIIKGNAFRGTTFGCTHSSTCSESWEADTSLRLTGIPIETNFVYAAIDINSITDGKKYKIFNVDTSSNNTLTAGSGWGQPDFLILTNQSDSLQYVGEAYESSVIINQLEWLTGYYNLREWVEAYKEGDDEVTDTLKSWFENHENQPYNYDMTIDISAALEGGVNKQSIGTIEINGNITKKGYEILIKELTEEAAKL